MRRSILALITLLLVITLSSVAFAQTAPVAPTCFRAHTGAPGTGPVQLEWCAYPDETVYLLVKKKVQTGVDYYFGLPRYGPFVPVAILPASATTWDDVHAVASSSSIYSTVIYELDAVDPVTQLSTHQYGYWAGNRCCQP